MLSTNEFAEWSKQVVLALHNTSRVDGEPHPELLRQTGGLGFPTVSFLDTDGRLLLQVGNVVTLDQCERARVRLHDWQLLRAAVERGDAGAAKEKELFLLELELGNRPFAEMAERRSALTFEDAEVATVDQRLVNLEIDEILRVTPRDQAVAAGERFVQMFRKSRIPDGANQTAFWQHQFAFASAQRDVPLFKELLAWLKEHRADDGRLTRYVRVLEQQLEQLEAGKGR